MSDPYRDIEAKERSEPPEEAKYWAKELDLARKRQKRFRKEAAEVEKLYEGDAAGENNFNILYSNTETLLPSIYNQLPRPDVDRTFHDEDPVAKESAEALERIIKNVVDSQNAEYDQFHRLFQQATLGALVPGQGITRIFYDAEIKNTTRTLEHDEGEEGHRHGSDPAAQDAAKKPFLPPETKSKVAYESICGKDLAYDQVLFGHARRWVDVPWVGFEHFMHKDDLVANFGAAVAEDIKLAPYSRPDPESGGKAAEGSEDGEHNHGSQQGAYVVEIWNKARREVVFYCETYDRKLIDDARDDPYELSGFYPICEPLKFQMKTSGLIPRPIYKLYEPQARELNRLSMRINKILNAMKVRGFYDGSLQGLKDLLQSDDNTLKAVPNASSFTEGKTLANSIWLMPLNELVTVLQQLMMGREACKQTIYEITGLSDIMRGDTKASETFGAQELKSKWGSQRLQKFQGEVQRYCRDCYRIIGELAAKNFAPRTFAQMTGLPYALPEEIQQAQRTMQVVQQLQMAAMAQQPPMPPPGSQPPAGGNPPAPPMPPQLQQAADAATAILAKPPWEAVVALVKNDVSRYYRIDIETNSTIDPTRQQDKADVQEAMTAMANTVESFGPLVEQRVIPMPVFKSLLKTVVSRFTFGRELEETIDQIPAEVPNTVNNTPEPAAGGEAGKSPEEMQAIVAKAGLDLKATLAKGQLLEKETQVKLAQHDAELTRIAQEKEMDGAKHMLTMKEIMAKMTLSDHEVKAKQAASAVEIGARKALAATDIDTKQRSAAVDMDVKQKTAAVDIDTKQKTTDATVEAAKKKAAMPRGNGKANGAAGGRKFKLVRGGDGRVSEIHES